jgi:hypothetical protein
VGWVSVRLPPPVIETIIDTTKVRYFHFDAVDRRNTNRIDGFTISDTTVASAGGGSVVKSYTFTTNPGNTGMRIVAQLYGRGGLGTGAEIRVNGVTVASYSVPYLAVVRAEYIQDVEPSTTYTVEIVNTGSDVLEVRWVNIMVGIKVDSTTPVTLVSLTGLDTEYTLQVNGNFVYRLGVRYWIKGNRKTTATATVTSNLSNEVEGYYRNLGAGDDDGEIFLTIRTGDFRPDPTISMSVGAPGDIVIVTGVYVHIVLRTIPPRLHVKVNERGLMASSAVLVSIDGAPTYLTISKKWMLWLDDIWDSPSSMEVRTIAPVVDVKPGDGLFSWNSRDDYARSLYLLLGLVVIAQ